MGDVKWTADDFARILSLPPEHPERRAAEKDPAFDAWERMQAVFESSQDAPLSEAEIAGPRAELSARLQRTLGIAMPGASAPARSVRSHGESGGWLGWFGAPAGRAALAFAVVAIVAASGWWISSRSPQEPAIRCGGSADALVLGEPDSAAGKLGLSWSAVPGAESYRVVFYDAELAEVARMDSVREPRLELLPGSLPAGLTAGARVEVEIVAIVHGDPVSRSRLRQVTLP